MAGLLNEILGAPVTWTPSGGSATALQAVFREEPVRVPDEDGSETLLVMPILRVQRPAADAIARGDLIAPGTGKTYRIEARHPSGSPASDAFVIFELELIP